MEAITVKQPTKLNVCIPLAVLYLIYTAINQREIYIKQFYSSILLIIVYETYGNRYSLSTQVSSQFRNLLLI